MKAVTRDEYCNLLKSGALAQGFSAVYPDGSCTKQRYITLCEKLPDNTGTWLFSAPGRTELAGNHTDHNNGRVLAASIQLDIACAAQKRDDLTVVLESDGYPEAFRVDLHTTDKVSTESGTTAALIRGVAAGLKTAGYAVGGFSACIHSSVPPGSGLSSSAAVEVLLGCIFSHLYNDGTIDPVTIAKTGQYAENEYFGKPCGLMDQLACAVGGIIAIDFSQPDNPSITQIHGNFGAYALCVIHTGGSHADLTDDYASIPREMRETAVLLDTPALSGLDLPDILDSCKEIRQELGDRHFLRSCHFFMENTRVTDMAAALESADTEHYIHLVCDCGFSSAVFLQNAFPVKNPNDQGITTGLCLSSMYLEGKGGASRIHGGGFAGTIQAYVPRNCLQGYTSFMERVFGKGSVHELFIRENGVCVIQPMT